MKNGKMSLHFHLPDIKHVSNHSKSVKNNNNDLIRKIKEKNTIKYQRYSEFSNHLKNWSRNSGFKKRKNCSSNAENIQNKISTIFNNTNNKNDNYNLTISCTLKDNKQEQDSNKTALFLNNNTNRDNKTIAKNNYFKRNLIDSIGEINSGQENSNNDKKMFLNNNNRYYLSDHNNTPNTIKPKKFELSTINLKVNLFNKFHNNNFNSNSNYLNYRLSKNNIIRKSSNSKINNNQKRIIINEDLSQNSNISINNNIKEVEQENAQKKIKKKYYIAHKKKSFAKININNIKCKLIIPGLMNSSSINFKENPFKSLEEDKKSYNPDLLKDIRKHENLNNVDNFIMILKQYIIIENDLNNILLEINNQNNNTNKINMIKILIEHFNVFFNHLNDISFEIVIFIDKEYNILLQKTIRLIIIFHTLLFILLSLYDINTFFTLFQIYYFEIFHQISFCLYNIFVKFIVKYLKSNKYNNLSFIGLFDEIYTDNPAYRIKASLSNTDVFYLIQKNYNVCIEKLIQILNNNPNNFMNEIISSIRNILLNINKNNLLYYIDICLNTFLYTLLNNNINKAILNSRITKNKNAFRSVPYLPPIVDESNYKYTIVLDLDETLGHFFVNEIKTKYCSNYGYFISNDKNDFNENSESKNKTKVGIFLIRPYAKYFLEELNNLSYEIVIFTAGTKEYSDKVLDILDLNNNLIKYRLYRTHLSLRNIDNDVKDLSLLGRNLDKVIMIDNLPENYKLQVDNGLPINSWVGDINDTSLKDLLPIMKYIIKNKVKDVRTIIKKIKLQLNNNNINYGKIQLD